MRELTSNDGVLGLDNCLGTVSASGLNGILIQKLAPSLDIINLVLLQETLNTFGETCKDPNSLSLELQMTSSAQPYAIFMLAVSWRQGWLAYR